MSTHDELLQQFNEAFAQEYASWDDVSREDLLYYLRVLLIESRMTRPPLLGEFPGCLLLALSWLRGLLWEPWDNSGVMTDPESYLGEHDG